MRRTAITIATVLLSLSAAAAAAASLAEQRARAEADAAIADEAEFTSTVCGGSLSAGFDWSSFDEDGRDIDEDAIDACDAALAAIESHCRSSEDGKDAVANGIDEVICTAGSGPDVDLSGGTLEFTIGGNGYDAVASFLSEAFDG